MKKSNFFAFISRMKYINRWGLMRSIKEENVSEHSLDVAVIAHALTIIQKKRLGKNSDPHKTALYAIYHDASEILTGDMPTPVKYFNPSIKTAYKEVELSADKISAYIKCIEEEKSGNREFIKAKQSLFKEINNMDRQDVKIFMDEFLEGYSLTLDEME